MSGREPATDRARLVGAAYGKPGPLLARAALYAYERDPVDFASWVLDRVEAEHPISERSRVVDIGCGPGRYLAELGRRHPGIASVGLDLSSGMAAAALATGAPAGVADAMHLPIRSGSCDIAIAAHMLYHVPDIALAVAELARVTSPSGVVAIVVNGRNHLLELDEVASAAYAAVSGTPWTAPTRSSVRFLLDDAARFLAPALTVVEVHRTSREIVVTDPAPVVAYVESEESLF
ncbi:MAG: hypothetical protein QOF28_1191, partial [Actinomycetota bacterium]|nr:hypothetical protein [Actinomycetota bacterium]